MTLSAAKLRKPILIVPSSPQRIVAAQRSSPIRRASGVAAGLTVLAVSWKSTSPTRLALRCIPTAALAPENPSGSPVTGTTGSETSLLSSKTARTRARSRTTRSRVCSVPAIRRIHLLLAQRAQQTPTPQARLATPTIQTATSEAKPCPRANFPALRAQGLRRSTAQNKALLVRPVFQGREV